MKRWLIVLPIALLAGCSAPALPPVSAAERGGITFALMGDTPYSMTEARALDAMIEEMNREELAFVIHVGDITAGNGPCTDEWLEARRRQFMKSKHPFIIVPGDNDWVDCHRSGFDPLERLHRFRGLFEAGSGSLGQRSMALERQSDSNFPERFREFREHMRWIAGNVLFVGLNVQGSNNNLGRTPQMDAEHRRRMAAVFAWLDDGVRLARERGLSGMIVFAQADPDFEGRFRRRSGEPDGFLEFRNALRALAIGFGKPVLFVNGDSHFFRLDQPLADPATGGPVRNFTRVIVFGSPQVRWIRAAIDPSSAQMFQISPALPPAPER